LLSRNSSPQDVGYDEQAIKLVDDVMMSRNIPNPRDMRLHDLLGPFGMINYRLLLAAKVVQVRAARVGVWSVGWGVVGVISAGTDRQPLDSTDLLGLLWGCSKVWQPQCCGLHMVGRVWQACSW
jgi:hypothetical protein